MTDLKQLALSKKEEDFDALLGELRKGLPKMDMKALAHMANPERMMNNSITIKNLDPRGHLLGINIDFSGREAQVRIPPYGSQRVENFSFLTMWFIRLQVDPPVQLTNNLNNVCFYQVNLLKTNGQNTQQQFLNPHAGATVKYMLDVGDRLIVVPVGMHRYFLDNPEVWQDYEGLVARDPNESEDDG